MDQICPERKITTEKEKSEHHYWILDIQIIQGMKFQLKLTILIFWNKFAQKGYFQSKKWKKWASPLNSVYSKYYSYQISASTDNFDILDQIFQKRIFPVRKGKIALVRASLVVTYYIKYFRTGNDRHNGILMSLLLLLADTLKALEKKH